MNSRWRVAVLIGLMVAAAGSGVGARAAGLGPSAPFTASATKKPQPTPPPKPHQSPAASVELMATPDELICDGVHTSSIQVHLRDADGHDVEDGTPVYFQINGRTGSLQPGVATTKKGVAESDARVTFDQDALYGPFFVQVDSAKLEATLRVFCLPPSDCAATPCPPCQSPLSPPQFSPPPCSPPCDPLSPPQAFSPPCGGQTCDPTSPPQAFSPPCGGQTCDPASPPQDVSPPCAVPTPPPLPPCEPTSPPQSPPACATPTPGCSPFVPESPPCVPPTPTPTPCGAPTSPPCGGDSEFAVVLDCDIATAGVQSECTVPLGTSSLDVAVVFENNSDFATTLAAFNFEVHDSDTSRLYPPPAVDKSFDSNPDFNQADLTTSWNCAAPPPTNDSGQDGPGRAVSFLSCFKGGSLPITIEAGGRITLAVVHYSIPAEAPHGDVQLALDHVSAANGNADTLVACDTGFVPCSPPAIVTIN